MIGLTNSGEILTFSHRECFHFAPPCLPPYHWSICRKHFQSIPVDKSEAKITLGQSDDILRACWRLIPFRCMQLNQKHQSLSRGHNSSCTKPNTQAHIGVWQGDFCWGSCTDRIHEKCAQCHISNICAARRRTCREMGYTQKCFFTITSSLEESRRFAPSAWNVAFQNVYVEMHENNILEILCKSLPLIDICDYNVAARYLRTFNTL